MSRAEPITWEGWYDGEKRPHQQTFAEITYVPATGEVRVDIYDRTLTFLGAPGSRVAALYRGSDFPRRHILKPNNKPVATSGYFLPGDLVVGNKLVLEAGTPPIVLLIGPPPAECVPLCDRYRRALLSPWW